MDRVLVALAHDVFDVVALDDRALHPVSLSRLRSAPPPPDDPDGSLEGMAMHEALLEDVSSGPPAALPDPSDRPDAHLPRPVVGGPGSSAPALS